MKIALIESNIVWEDKAANISRLEKELKTIKNDNIDLVLLPEMSFTGFSMNVAETKESDMQTVDRVKELSSRYDICIGAGYVKDAGKFCENRYTLCNRGEVIADYAKIHPFSYSEENKYFTGGDELCATAFKDFDIGLTICYDLRFPEIYSQLSKRTQLIVVAANWPAKRSEHWKKLLMARAIENQAYMAAVNCVGDIGGLNYSGDSMIVNPDGNACEREVINIESDNIYIYDINNDVESYRTTFPVKQDRREELYISMIK